MPNNKSLLPDNYSHIPVHITQQATEWYVRLQADDVTEQDFCEFQVWLQADQQHQDAWHCLEQFGLSLGSIKHPLLQQALTAIDRTTAHPQLFSLKSMIWLIVFGSSIVAIMTAPQQQLWQQWQADYRTKVGEQRRIQLEDGSHIILNTDTAININYDHTHRQIELIKGEIHIEVMQDQRRRPFSVHNRDGIMQDIGTTFNIRQYDKHTVLAVSEGQVKVTAKKSQNTADLHAQQQVIFNQHSIQNVLPLNSEYMSWKNGTLSVYKMPLTEFIIELDRYHDGKLRYDINVAKLEVSGVFPLHDSEQVLHSLEQQLPIKVESQFYYWKKLSLEEK